MATSTLTISQDTNGLLIFVTNPFPSEYLSSPTYTLYVGTDLTKLPPNATPTTPTYQISSCDYEQVRFLYTKGTAGTTYYAVATIEDSNGTVVTTNVSTGTVMPTPPATQTPLTLNSTALVVVGNDSAMYIGQTDTNHLMMNGSGGSSANGATFPAAVEIQRGTTYNAYGSGFTKLGWITTLPWRDPNVEAGTKYYYNLWAQDDNGGSSNTVEAAADPSVIPASVGAIRPDAPTVQVFPGDGCLWVFVEPGADNGAPITQYVMSVASSTWDRPNSAPVVAADGPWFKVTVDSTGTTIANGVAYWVTVAAVNMIGTSDFSLIGNSVAAATATTLTVTNFGTTSGAASGTPLDLIYYTLEGGVPPYTATLYLGYNSNLTKATAFATYKNALPGMGINTANNSNINYLLTVVDSTGATVSLGPAGLNSYGSYAPGDMSTYIDGWLENTDSVYVSEATSLRQVWVVGAIGPTGSDSVTNHVGMYEGQARLFDAKNSMSIQGQTSAGTDFLGFKFKLKNKDTGDKLELKFGGWAAGSTYDVKSYGYTDDTQMRDILANRLWHRVRTGYPSYPESLGFPASALGGSGTITDLYGETSLATFGFPVEMYFNGQYQGLYIWRQASDPSMYQMDTSNPNHIMMKYDHSGGTGNGQEVDLIDYTQALKPADWNMKSPNIKAYTDQASLATQAPVQYAAFNAWWTIIQTYLNTPNDANWAAVEAVLDKNAMIDYVVFSEAVWNSDGVNDNYILLSWDGKVFVPNTYDMDLTFGNNNSDTPPDTTTQPLLMSRDPFWGMVYTNWLPEVKARYKFLRDTGIISTKALTDDARQLSGMMNRNAKMRNFAAWGGRGGYQTEGPVSFVLSWYQARLATLDTQFDYNGTTTVLWS